MRFLSANKIFNGYSFLPKDVVLIMSKSGEVLDIKPAFEIDSSKIEKLSGILSPGFINTHCHLELSYLKGKIEVGKGLNNFIKDIEVLKKVSDEEVFLAIEAADKEMFESGIVAVGDISNNNSTFKFKPLSKIYYHNFIEVFGFDPSKADSSFEKGKSFFNELKTIYEKKHLDCCSIVPHAPYSASIKLLKKIDDFAFQNNSILTIHNQENEDENLLFNSKSGKILERLNYFGVDTEGWRATGKNSLESCLTFLPRHLKIQLVHNTFSCQKDIDFATEYSKSIFWCFCPNANLYIENRLPDVCLFLKNNCQITLGTDSYASNWSLNIVDEINTILKNFPIINLETVLSWATINGAKYLGIDTTFGSFEKGKKPGLVLLSDLKGIYSAKKI